MSQLRTLSAIGLSGVAQILVATVYTYLGRWIPYPGYDKGLFQLLSDELGGNKEMYRDFEKDFIALYWAVFAPFVTASLFTWILNYFNKLTGTWRDGMRFGAIMWVLSSLQGLFMDHTYLNQPFYIFVGMATTSLLQAVVNGAIVFYFLGSTEKGKRN